VIQVVPERVDALISSVLVRLRRHPKLAFQAHSEQVQGLAAGAESQVKPLLWSGLLEAPSAVEEQTALLPDLSVSTDGRQAREEFEKMSFEPHALHEIPDAMRLRTWEVAGPVSRSQEIRPPDLATMPADTEDACRRSLELLAKEQDEKVRRDLESAASQIIEQTRSLLQNEASDALMAFSKQAMARLQLYEERRSQPLSEIQAQLAEVKKQISEVRAAAQKPQLELQTMSDKLENLLADGELASRLALAHENTQEACRRAEAATKNITLTGEAAVDKLTALERKMEARFSEAVDDLRRKSDESLKSSAVRLEKQANELAELLTRKLLASQADLVADAKSRLAAASQASLESLMREATAVSDQRRAQLQQKLNEPAGYIVGQAEWDRGRLPEQPRSAFIRGIEAGETTSGELRRTLVTASRGAVTSNRLRVTAMWLTSISPALLLVLLSVFVFFSIHPVMQLRPVPPAEFFDHGQDWSWKRRTTEDRLALAYWESAVRYVQSEYSFGAELPDSPPSEFKPEGKLLQGVTAKTDPDSRTRYWQKLRQVWVLPQVWEKSYTWSTKWVDGIRQKP
jgi:hypothetical protein